MNNPRKIPFSPPDINEDDIAEVVDTLRSGWITTGPKTKKFEEELAKRFHTKKAVCLNSQTAAAEMTLRLLGIGPGDEVIVPAYTYTASASVIEHVGATIVMVDAQKDSFEMDYGKLEQAITSKTKVIIPVDLCGIICDYNKIFEIVNKKKSLFKASENKYQKAFNRIIVMADGAHALGSTWHNQVCGNIADFTNFSFHAVKNLTTAEGGAVTWREIDGIDSEEMYHQYMLLSLHGQSKDALSKTQIGAWEYDVIGTYYKCNMTDVLASLGLSQLRRYDKLIDRRHIIIGRYNQAFKNENVTFLNHEDDHHKSSGHLYLLRLNNADTEIRNQFIIEMAKKGVICNVHYKPLPMMSAYKKLGFNIDDYPNSYNLYKNEVTLPLHTCLSDEDVEYVITCVIDVLKELHI